jgi:hypothetical protein
LVIEVFFIGHILSCLFEVEWYLPANYNKGMAFLVPY